MFLNRKNPSRLFVHGVFVACVCMLTSLAMAQEAWVTSLTEVHYAPNKASPIMMSLQKGETVEVSYDPIKSIDGDLWHRIRFENGEYGYARANHLLTKNQKKELKRAGFQSFARRAVPQASNSWSFSLRSMGLLGYNEAGENLFYGGEVEFAYNLFRSESSYTHRKFALGPVFVGGNDVRFIGASLVYRIFAESLSEPELRFRVGTDTTSGGFAAGFNAGLRYPFSRQAAKFWSGYLEGASLIVISSTTMVYLWGSAGIGFHF